MKIGIIGCGNISGTYLLNEHTFADVAYTHFADLRPELARERASQNGGIACSVDDLLASDIDTVLNLTVPNAHAEVALAAIAAGKHVYTEKPLAVTRAEGQQILSAAKAAGVTVASAPDTVLGPGVQTARRLITEGRIGKPLSGISTMMTRGMMAWHPNPDFFFQPGGGPVLDMGPYYVSMMIQLLGPITKVSAQGSIGITNRVIAAPGAARFGDSVPVDTMTTLQGVLGFASGAQVAFSYSWDVLQHGGRPLEIYGETGGLRLPDPNYFGGLVELSKGVDPWQVIDTSTLPYGTVNFPPDAPRAANFRGLGLQDMAEALAAGRTPRCSGAVGYHVLDVLLAIHESAQEERTITLTSGQDLTAPTALDGHA